MGDELFPRIGDALIFVGILTAKAMFALWACWPFLA
jgi:hypothetical protein